MHSTVMRGFASPAKEDSLHDDVASAKTPVPPEPAELSKLLAPSEPSEPAVYLPSVGDIVDDHYILVRMLGEGSFARVYFAQRVDVPEHQVALKIFARAVYEGRNVERELVMLATVGHPNVVQLKDHGTDAGYVWFTMPVYEGETLEERLKRGALTMREAYDIFVPVARGLEALHSAGLRHQDIKPDNIYLARFGGRVHPILLDLGAAAELEANFVAGTLLYAAPEQIAYLSGNPGSAVLTEKMDTYGLGTTLLTALVGASAFPGATAETADEIQEAHELRAREPLSDKALPELTGKPRDLLKSALRRWLSLNPKDRPTMSELAEELDVLREPEREEARAEERRRVRQKASLQRVRAAALGLLLVGAAAGFYLYSKRETLALAGALESARREGAESFDKLDTCVASHSIEKSAAASCRSSREKDQAEFNASLDAVKKAGSATMAERARQIEMLQGIFAARLKSTEEAAAKALEALRQSTADEKARIEAACLSDKGELAKELDEQKKLVESRTRGLEVCDTARHELLAERETWKASVAVSPGSSAVTSAPAAPAAPAPNTVGEAAPGSPSPATSPSSAPVSAPSESPQAPAPITPASPAPTPSIAPSPPPEPPAPPSTSPPPSAKSDPTGI